jgi:Tol biopolymer transport system component
MRNKLIKSTLMAVAVIASSCVSKNDDQIIGKQNPEIKNGRITPEVLWAFGRVGGLQVSPDTKKVLYSVSYYSIAADKGNSELFVMNADGTDKKQITETSTREASAKWMNDNQRIAFLSAESGSMQRFCFFAQ